MMLSGLSGRRFSAWDLPVTGISRRPSFPQGGLDWRLRHKHSQDKRPAKKNSGCGREQIRNGPEKEKDNCCGLFPESIPHDHCQCPMIRIVDGNPELDPTHFFLEDAESQDTTPASNASRKDSQCSCPGCPASISFPSSNGQGLHHGGRCSWLHDRGHQWRSSKETVIINVGGQIFETYRSTLKRLKTPIFNSEEMFKLYFRKSHGDYFFDRDPTAFGSVLNFLRTGELHIPTNMCGPALQNELEFWGMEELDIARCCWTQYNTWKTQCRSLEKLEYDRKFSTTQQFNNVRSDSSAWVKFRSRIWTFLQDPGSSRKAKAYAWVSIIFVFVSIFSFCAETHPMFKVKAKDMISFASFYEFFNFESIPWDVLINRTLTSHPSEARENHSALPRTGITNNQTKETSPISDYYINDDNAHDDDDNYYTNDFVEDVDDWGNKDLPHPALLIMDVSCLIFFSLEYLTRFLCSPNKMDFIRALQNIVDFLAFAPDYIELLFLLFDPGQGEGAHIMEMFFILRILRLFRIFRLIRHVPGLWILLYTLKASFNELMLMCVFLLIGMVVFATLIHFVEPDGGFNNIPVGFWWSVVTMTTVGYGDMFPQSAGGYIIGSCCAVAGLLMIAFTVPIIVSNFVLYYTHVQYGLARKDREAEKQRMLDEAGEAGEAQTGQTEAKVMLGEEGDDGGLAKGMGEQRYEVEEGKKKKGRKKTKKKIGGGRVNVKDNAESNSRRTFEDKMADLDVEAPPITTTRNGNSYFGIRNSDVMEMRERDVDL